MAITFSPAPENFVLKIYEFTHWKKYESFQEHIVGSIKVIINLENMDVSIKDEDQALLLVSSLPNSCKHLCDTLVYGKDTLSL